MDVWHQNGKSLLPAGGRWVEDGDAGEAEIRNGGEGEEKRMRNREMPPVGQNEGQTR